MDDMAKILQRANLRDLGWFLMEDIPLEEESAEILTEAQIRYFLDEDMRLALHTGGESLAPRIKEILERAWEKGKAVGFMTGLRAGARTTLSLLGEGEILI